ncbi:hypothetical protein [Streptomyces anandii]|uniref:hypothetical protein n=1 Tax=Streptomyces anandii TaxID=285454 RepID=UPI00167B6BAD|nr:hypothetical protein [Streptomyces anandii]
MEEGRYLALKSDKHDYTWDKAWSYHASGALLNFIPVYGDLAQRGADVLTSAWVMDEPQHQDVGLGTAAVVLLGGAGVAYTLIRKRHSAVG